MSTTLLTLLLQHWHYRFPPKTIFMLESEHASPSVRLTVVRLTVTWLEDIRAQSKKTQQLYPYLWPIVVDFVFEPISRCRPLYSWHLKHEYTISDIPLSEMTSKASPKQKTLHGRWARTDICATECVTRSQYLKAPPLQTLLFPFVLRLHGFTRNNLFANFPAAQ